jgi:sulfite reductase (ferredoxin)
MLGHPDAQDFGRKFKASFSGCQQHPCGLVAFHDLGLVAKVGPDGGRGFEVWIGGGLGAIPRKAVLYAEFLPETELLPLAQALSRVFARLGEKKNRAKARLKFLIAKLGIDELRRLIEEERAELKSDSAWTDWLDADPPAAVADDGDGEHLAALDDWHATNVYAQRQAGYSAVTVSLPLGDLTSTQCRALADLVRGYGEDCVRTTVEQNLLLRWIPNADLPAVRAALDATGLGAPGAGTIVDVTACPGTDTCKLGIASSRGLAAVLREGLAAKAYELDEAVRGLRIKVSGCFNSCGQHQVADLGFYGVSRNSGGYAVPHFQVVLGGQWTDNAREFGMAMGAVPSKRIPEVVDLLADAWMSERQADESFQGWIARLGKVAIKSKLKPLMAIPDFVVDSSLFTDWADDRVFTLGDLGVGECAGEVVSLADFGLAEAERLEFEAQVRQEQGEHAAAGDAALAAMVEAAKALLKQQTPDVEEDSDWIVRQFRTRVYDPGLFHDPFAGGKFAQYLFRQHDDESKASTPEDARQRIEEAQLFIEAAHACRTRLMNAQGVL